MTVRYFEVFKTSNAEAQRYGHVTRNWRVQSGTIIGEYSGAYVEYLLKNGV